MPVPDDLPESLLKIMSAYMEIGWLIPLVGVIEIVGGILFITNKFRALGAIVILPVMVGVLLTHTVNAPSGLPMALALFIVNIWVIYENRHKYMPMLQK